MRPIIQLVVTDLDNTLYDWVTSFVPAFYSMIAVASRLLDVSEAELLDDIQAVHRRHGSSEYPFALLETAVVRRRFSGLPRPEIKERLDAAFHAFNKLRKQSLCLYEGVRETLKSIQDNGGVIVGHTDAHAGNSMFRLGKLGLVNLITRLYAPQSLNNMELINFSVESEDVPSGYIRPLPLEDRKPNPKVLLDICSEYHVLPENTLYVGDSLVRDVLMAKRAGVNSAWARYGNTFSRDLWAKLVRVTHWTEDDVRREEQLQAEAAGIHPDVTLEHFSDILTHFTFSRPGFPVVGKDAITMGDKTL
ncbi:MAG TPA: HAD family hydrolase [Candidatus Angelobacter sp.]|nr:HAD family hydrolase [Candidatus Angelobacter sp.]